jgi:hypothetical protein
MNDEIDGIWKEVVVVYSMYYPNICLGIEETTPKNLSRIDWRFDRNSKPGSPEYKHGALLLDQPVR